MQVYKQISKVILSSNNARSLKKDWMHQISNYYVNACIVVLYSYDQLHFVSITHENPLTFSWSFLDVVFLDTFEEHIPKTMPEICLIHINTTHKNTLRLILCRHSKYLQKKLCWVQTFFLLFVSLWCVSVLFLISLFLLF